MKAKQTIKSITSTLASSALLFAATGAAVQAQQNELGWTMDSAVKQLDRQGSDMESVLAEVVIDYSGGDESLDRVKAGRIYINSRGEVRLSASDPEGLVVLMENRTVHYYYPNESRVDEYSLSKHPGRLEQFVPLGFSTTGRDLDRDFLVTFIGEESSDGRRLLGLELTPKSDDLRAVVARMQIWVDEASWLPARQVITRSAGQDTLTINYSGTARNLSLNPKLFDDDWPRGTDKVRK